MDDVGTDFRSSRRDVFDVVFSENSNMADFVSSCFEHGARSHDVHSAGTLGEYHADVRRAKLRGSLRVGGPRYPTELDTGQAPISHVPLSLRR